MSYNTIKQSIDDNIKQNGKQQITGPVLNTILTELLKALGDLNLRQYVYISVAPTLNTLNKIETLTIPAQSVYLNGTAANVPVQNSVIQLSSNWNYQHIIFNATTKAFSAASAQARRPWLEENEYYAGTIRKSGANGKWSFITWNGNTFVVDGVEYSQSAPIETRYLYSATENEVSPASFVAGNIVQFRKRPSDMGTISILFDTNVNENLLIYVGTKSDGSDMSQIATIPGALAGAKQYLFLDDYNRDALYISIRCGSSYSADIHYSVQFTGSSINSVYRRTYLPLKNAFINQPPILNSEEGTITFPANTAVFCEGMSNYITLGRAVTLSFVSGYKFVYIYYYADCNSFLITNILQFRSNEKKFRNIFHVATLRVQNGDLKPYFIKLNATSAVIDGTTYKCFLPESDANLAQKLNALQNNLRQYVYISVAPTLNTLNEIETLTIPAQSVYLNGTAANVPVQNSVIQLSSNWNYQHIIFNATTKAFSAASAQARKPWLEENEYYAGTIRKSGANGKWSFITWNGNTFVVDGVEYSQSAPIETRYLYSTNENKIDAVNFVAGNIVQFRKRPSDMGTISITFDTDVNENITIHVGNKYDGTGMVQIATIPGALANTTQFLYLDDYNRDALYISIRCGSSYSADIHYSVQFTGSSINSVYRRTYLPLKNAFINQPPILNSEEGTITFTANTAVYCEGMSNYITLGREVTLSFDSGYKFAYIYYYADCNSFLITNILQFRSNEKKFRNIFHVATLRVQNGNLKPYFIKLNATSAVIDGTTYKCFLPESDANLAQKLNALQNKVDNNIAHWFVSSNEPPIFDAVNRHLTVPAQLMYVMGRQFRTTKSLEVDLPTGQNLYWVKLQYNPSTPDDSVLIAGRVAEAVPVLGDNEYYYCMVRLSSNGDCSIFTINAISFIIRRGTIDILCESKSLAGNVELMNSLKEVSSYVQFRPGNVTSAGVLNTDANYAVSDLIPISEGQGIKEIFIKKRDNFIFATRAAKFLSGWDINGNYVNVSIPVIKADDKTGVVSFYYDQTYRFIRVVCDNKATSTFLKHEAASIIAIGDAPGYDYRGNFSRAYAATNPKLDYRKDTFCVLDIGNSYTNDSTRVLPDIFSFFKTKFNLDYSKTVLYKLTRPSASFASHCDIYAGKDTQPYQIVKVAGDYNIGLADQTGIPGTNRQPFRDALQKYPWDLILIHQASNYSNDYALWQRKSDSGRLHQLVMILQRCCPQATIGQLLVHSYAGSDSRNTEGSTELRWLHNAQAAKQLSENYGIDFIVPYGTAVENLRRTSLNNAYDLTRDGTHLGFGLCQFAAACSYWQSVFAPRFNKSVIEFITGGFTLPDPGDGSWTGNSAIPVTTANSFVGAYAGLWACTNAFSLHNPQKETTETL